RMNRGHALQILEMFTVEKSDDIDRDLQEGMQKIVSALEHGIRPHVNQWAMFQSVWPKHAPAPVRVFPVGSPLESELLERVAAVLPERKPSARKRHTKSVLSPLVKLRNAWRREPKAHED
ncbi:MAG: lysophospholipid acyltransferase family protein, partial [Thermomicrobiales bacterium]